MEGPNARDQLRSVHSNHSSWKSKQMLATYMRRMRNATWTLGLRAPVMADKTWLFYVIFIHKNCVGVFLPDHLLF